MFSGGNRIQVVLDALDRISPVVDNLKQKFNSLQPALQKMSGAGYWDKFQSDGIKATDRDYFSKIRSGLNGLTEQANTFMGVFTGQAAFMVASQAVGSLSSKIRESANLQQSMLADAAGFSYASGIDYQGSQDFLKSFNQDLAKSAANLPGNTSEYVNLANSISTLAVKAFPVTDDKGNPSQDGLAKYSSEVQNLVEKVSVLGSSKGLEGSDVNLFATKFLAGTGLGELRQLSFAERNMPMFLDIKDRLAKQNVNEEDFGKLSVKERFDLLNSAVSAVIPGTLVEDLRDTVGSAFDRLASAFDPLSGTFGFLREVANTGGRTVMDAFESFLDSLLDMAEAIGGLFTRLGFGGDILYPLVKLFDFLGYLARAATTMVNGMGANGGTDWLSAIGNLIKGAGDFLAQFGNEAIDALANFAVNFDTVRISTAMANFINSSIAGVTRWLMDIDWFKLGAAISLTVFNIAETLAATLFKIDGVGILKFMASAAFALMRLVAGAVVGIGAGVVKSVVDNIVVPIVDLGVSIGNGIERVKNVAANLFKPIVDFLNTPISVPKTVLPRIALPTINLAPITNAVKALFTSAGNSFNWLGNSFMSLVSGFPVDIENAYNKFMVGVSNIGKYMGGLGKELKAAFKAFTNVLDTFFISPVKASMSVLGSVFKAIENGFRTFLNSVQGVLSTVNKVNPFKDGFNFSLPEVDLNPFDNKKEEPKIKAAANPAPAPASKPELVSSLPLISLPQPVQNIAFNPQLVSSTPYTGKSNPISVARPVEPRSVTNSNSSTSNRNMTNNIYIQPQEGMDVQQLASVILDKISGDFRMYQESSLGNA